MDFLKVIFYIKFDYPFHNGKENCTTDINIEIFIPNQTFSMLLIKHS